VNSVDIVYERLKGFPIPQYQIIVDGVLLNDFLNSETNSNDFDLLVPPIGLMFEQDQKKVFELLEYRNVIFPLLVCPDDLDFSCIVVSVYVTEKKNQTTWEYWAYGLDMSKPIHCRKLIFDKNEYRNFVNKFKSYIICENKYMG